MQKRKAFTLVELLVVVAIIALLVAILVPAVTKAREQANISVCAVNLHQIMIGMHMYHNEHGRIPPGWPPYVNEEKNIYFYTGTYTWHSNHPLTLGEYPTGLGLLYHQGYAPAADIYWCPSTTFPFIHHDKETQIGFLVKPTVNQHSESSYIYRLRTGYDYGVGTETLWSGTSDRKYGQFNHVITINDFSADLSAVVDTHFYPRDEAKPSRSNHKVGLNAAYWEGNVSWVYDPDPDRHTAHLVGGPRGSKAHNTSFWLADFPHQAENY